MGGLSSHVLSCPVSAESSSAEQSSTSSSGVQSVPALQTTNSSSMDLTALNKGEDRYRPHQMHARAGTLHT